VGRPKGSIDTYLMLANLRFFALQSLIQFRVRLQSHLIAAIVSKQRYFVEACAQGLDSKV
jgi:hypothetical protein